MITINDQFTSTGKKFFHHRAALEGLRTDNPRPVVSHIMLTDRCQHTCAFCSVQTREGNTLSKQVINDYLDKLVPLGLKAVILSGGGNPILYKTPDCDFNGIVDLIHSKGLEIGLITNGMPLSDYKGYYEWHDGQKQDFAAITKYPSTGPHDTIRRSWKTVRPDTLDKLTWVRISMSGLDHKEGQVFVPDIDKTKTTLGFSYVYHDIYEVPEEPNHGKVSTLDDLKQFGGSAKSVRLAEDRFETITGQIREIVQKHQPEYVRLLPNCLEPPKIKARCDRLQDMANAIDPTRVFVQFKPPEAPAACYLGYLHPVLNSDGYVYPCDSCVLNKSANHKFAEPWRICRWDEVDRVYSDPVRSLIKDPKTLCPGCVFTKSNKLLIAVKDGMELPQPEPVQHPNFV